MFRYSLPEETFFCSTYTLWQVYATFGAQLCVALKRGNFGKQIRNTLKILICDAGEGRRRSVGMIMLNI
jgi:hypothetical protein